MKEKKNMKKKGRKKKTYFSKSKQTILGVKNFFKKIFRRITNKMRNVKQKTVVENVTVGIGSGKKKNIFEEKFCSKKKQKQH